MNRDPIALRRRIEQFVDDGVLCVGAQVSVSHGGTHHDIAVGSAGPGMDVTPASVWRLYCTAKPALAVAVALLVQDGLVDLDVPVADHPDTDELAHCRSTPRQLLDHTAGLHEIHGVAFGALPWSARDRAVKALRPPVGWDPARHAGYGEYAPWHVLGLLVESVTGRPVADVLRREVCQPFAAGELWFAMSDEQYDRLYPRLAVASDLRGPHPVPLLANRNRRPCTDVNLAYGGYGTARGLQRFYRTLLDTLAGRNPTRLRRRSLVTLLQPSRGCRYDEILGRPCDFGLGFMVRLDDHGFEPYVSPSAFGHTGYHGSSVALADPEADVAVSIVWNGVVDGELGVHTRRNAALRALYRDLGAEVGAGRTVGDPRARVEVP